MSDEWYYTQHGQQRGPVPSVELKKLAKSGQLQPNDLIWRDGMANWTEARRLRGLFATQPAEASAPPPAARAESLPVAVEVAPRRERLPEDLEPAPRRPRSRRRRSRSTSPATLALIIGGVVGALLVVGLGIWAIVSFTRQSSEYSWSLAQGHKRDFSLSFTGGKKVEIWVQSEQNSDIDLFVYDANNVRVAVDEGDSKDCYVTFVPRATQTYRVEVQNRVRLEPWLQHRNVPNRGTLRYQESEPGARP